MIHFATPPRIAWPARRDEIANPRAGRHLRHDRLGPGRHWGLAALHAVHLLRKDFTDDRRGKEESSDRRSESPPPERPDQGDNARKPKSSGEQRWTRREEKLHSGSQGYARHR